MDLNSLLEKSKIKGAKIKNKRAPIFVATDDRPYDVTIDNRTDFNQASNRPQNGFKKTSNQTQSDLPKDFKLASIGLQTDLKQTAYELQTIVKEPAKQLQTNSQTDCKFSLDELVTLQKDLMLIFFHDCQRNGSRITSALTLDYLFSQTDKPIKSIKSSAYRLEKKLYIIRNQFKNGRGGWTKYEIPEHIYIELYRLQTSDKQTSNRLQTDFKITSKLTAMDAHYNSNSKITTIGEGWDEIDISPLEHLGFKKTQLLQLKNVNAPDIVQESINHFAFALEHNSKVKTYETPLTVLMSVLKRGEGWIEPNYISPQEKAQQELLNFKRQQRERAEQRQKEIYDLEFADWREKLTLEQIKEIAPGKMPPQQVALSLYFKEKIWPNVEKS